MPVRIADAEWKGTLKEGGGTLSLGSGAFKGDYTFASRFEAGKGTNPEELIGAAHAGCFSMALSLMLEKAGYDPGRIETRAHVHLEKDGEDFRIRRVKLVTEASVPEIDEDAFQKHAEAAKEGCPVSKALAGTAIDLEATLVEPS